MISKCLSVCVLLSCVAGILGSCKSPTITSTSYTTEDGTIVSQVAYITEFSLKCGNEDASIPLFSEYEGRISPVARIGENKYQVSWSEEIKNSRSGEHLIRLFDEDGFAALRKAQRSGESLDSVSPLTTVAVKHRGVYKGAWVNSEILFTGLIALTAYVAFSTKSKIVG